ncbi:MAG TPA: DUF6680 family protein [Pyrinomonadaceae bacterium]|nr:DUF6680 family protein [Pyrinomonadaceae bacterium]
MKSYDLLMLLAVLLSPFLAVYANIAIERRRQRRERRLRIFKTLMATRASGLSPDHVQALNMIDIEFYGRDKKSKEVLQAWKSYLDHLGDQASYPDSSRWVERRIDLFIDLMHNMSISLGYDFDKVHIRRTSYFPKGFGELEDDQTIIRKGIVAWLKGELSVPMRVTDFPDMEPLGTQPQIPASASEPKPDA